MCDDSAREEVMQGQNGEATGSEVGEQAAPVMQDMENGGTAGPLEMETYMELLKQQVRSETNHANVNFQLSMSRELLCSLEKIQVFVVLFPLLLLFIVFLALLIAGANILTWSKNS